LRLEKTQKDLKRPKKTQKDNIRHLKTIHREEANLYASLKGKLKRELWKEFSQKDFLLLVFWIGFLI
jgi:hypothetical protein